MSNRAAYAIAHALNISEDQVGIMRDAAVREYREQGHYLEDKTDGVKQRITRAMRVSEGYRQAVYAWWKEARP